MKKSTVLLRNIDCLMTLHGASKKHARRINEEDLSIVEKSAVLIQNGTFKWIGLNKNVPKDFIKYKPLEVSFVGKTVLPGLVECHTHALFSGTRSDEFESRLLGKTYLEIAKAGGGILSTVRKTRSSNNQKLFKETQERVDCFLKQGVTTLEVKTGYALNKKDELKCLKVINKLKGPRIIPTFLGAHSLPPEFNNVKVYLEFIKNEVLPEIMKQKLAKRLDIFIEDGFFDLKSAREFLIHSKLSGFEITIHADQLTLNGGAELAVELGARSADHLIQIKEDQINKLAHSEVTAVLLPLADLYMKMKYPPARKLIESGTRVALATDFNPGSAPSMDLSLVGLLARLEMRMSLPEVIVAYTLGAAYALGLSKEIGSIEIGKFADFIVSEKSWTELFYSAGSVYPQEIWRAGKKLNTASKI